MSKKNRLENSVVKRPMVRKITIKKIKVKFIFEDLEGKKYSNGTGRLKIDKEGFISFLILTAENSWKGIKGKLNSLKVIQAPLKKSA